MAAYADPRVVSSWAAPPAALAVNDRSLESGRAVSPHQRTVWADYAWSSLIVAAATSLDSFLQPHFERSNLVMVYLLGVMWAAVRLGRGPAIFASVLSVFLFDFLYVPPHFTLAVSDSQYLVTLGVMLAAAVLISTLGARLKLQARSARQDARRSRLLARLSGDLVAIPDRDRILSASLRHLQDIFDSRAVVLLPETGGRLAVAAGDAELLGPDGGERGVAQWAFDAGQAAGLGTTTLPDSLCLHLPLRGSRGELGILAVAPADLRRLMAPDTFRLLQAFANQTALALERGHLADEAERARVQHETERSRNALLSSVSHDLRTPLAVITGVTSTLLEDEDSLSPAERREMLRTAAEEAARLNRLVGNLLAMTRLESGALEIKRSWHSIEELIGAALHRVDSLRANRPVLVDAPPDLPLVPVDDVLIEQVLFNLIENALKHAPGAEPIQIRARAGMGSAQVSVRDRGPGLSPGTEELIFEKFYRGAKDGSGGVGLGLAICRGIIEAHSGRIRAANTPGGGAEFTFTLPIGDGAPRVEAEPPVAPDARENGERDAR
jgi:two-component system sensor histidine kinase KdpD